MHVRVLLYIDDIIIVGDNVADITCLWDGLSVSEMKNYDEVKFFFGLEVQKAKDEFFLS